MATVLKRPPRSRAAGRISSRSHGPTSSPHFPTERRSPSSSSAQAAARPTSPPPARQSSSADVRRLHPTRGGMPGPFHGDAASSRVTPKEMRRLAASLTDLDAARCRVSLLRRGATEPPVDDGAAETHKGGPSRGALRLLRSSRYALTQPDAFGAGASRDGHSQYSQEIK